MITIQNFNQAISQINIKSIMMLLCFLIVGFIVIPFILTFLVSQLGRLVKRMLVATLGSQSQMIYGGLGVIIHEISHAVVALLFGHHITRLQLLNFKKDSTTLGSVEHYYNTNNLYQKLGNYFIGLAPFYGCSLVLYLFQKLILNVHLSFAHLGFLDVSTRPLNISTLLYFIKNSLNSIFLPFNVKTILFLVITIFISSTGFSLSKNDLKSSLKGVYPFTVILIFLGLLLTFFGKTTMMLPYIWYFINASILFAINAVIFIFITLIPLIIMYLINYFTLEVTQ